MSWRSRLPWLAAGGMASVVGTLAMEPTTLLEAAAAKRPHKADHDPNDKLVLVQVVFRHGARTPLTAKYWPTLVDKWDVCGQVYTPVPLHIVNEDDTPRPLNDHNEQQIATKLPGNCHKGELTREGQVQARNLGRWLRSRYMEELGLFPAEEYVDGIVHSRSTNYSRTLATLQGVLTGLFPGEERPIKVHTTESMDEILFAHMESCDRLKQLVKDTSSAARAAAALPPPEIKALGEHVRAALKLPLDESLNFLDVHDVMTTMRTHGKPIPEAMHDTEVLHKVEEQAVERFMAYVAPSGKEGDEVLRLGMGRLMNLIMQRMETALKSSTESSKDSKGSHNGPCMYLYSGHDSTIMPMLAALGKDIDHWPVYCANLTFELWKRPSGEPYVRVLYNREDLPLEEACGGANCTFKQLQKHVLPFSVTKEQRAKECVLHFSHDAPAGKHVSDVEVSIGSSIEEKD